MEIIALPVTKKMFLTSLHYTHTNIDCTFYWQNRWFDFFSSFSSSWNEYKLYIFVKKYRQNWIIDDREHYEWDFFCIWRVVSSFFFSKKVLGVTLLLSIEYSFRPVWKKRLAKNPFSIQKNSIHMYKNSYTAASKTYNKEDTKNHHWKIVHRNAKWIERLPNIFFEIAGCLWILMPRTICF